jgi:hypothetical protein
MRIISTKQNQMTVRHIFKNASFIDFRTLVRAKNVFNGMAFEHVKESAKKCNDTAGILVHPLFSSGYLEDKKDQGPYNDHSRENYSEYIGHVHNFLEKTDMPVFVFYDPTTTIDPRDPFIRDVNTSNTLIFVRTEMADPTPDIFNHRRPALIEFLDQNHSSGDNLIEPMINSAIAHRSDIDLFDYVADFYSDVYDFKIKHPNFEATYTANQERSWNTLKNTFLDLGIRSFVFGGEKWFTIVDKNFQTANGGCAHYLYNKLMKMNFNCSVKMDMVFPGKAAPEELSKIKAQIRNSTNGKDE